MVVTNLKVETYPNRTVFAPNSPSHAHQEVVTSVSVNGEKEYNFGKEERSIGYCSFCKKEMRMAL